MSVQVQVEIATGRILAYGLFPAGSPDPATVRVVELDDEQSAVLEQPGEKRVLGDGSIQVTPPPALPPPEPTRDERLLATITEKRSAVEAAPLDATTKQVLVGLLDGLADAITGGTP